MGPAGFSFGMGNWDIEDYSEFYDVEQTSESLRSTDSFTINFNQDEEDFLASLDDLDSSFFDEISQSQFLSSPFTIDPNYSTPTREQEKKEVDLSQSSMEYWQSPSPPLAKKRKFNEEEESKSPNDSFYGHSSTYLHHSQLTSPYPSADQQDGGQMNFLNTDILPDDSHPFNQQESYQQYPSHMNFSAHQQGSYQPGVSSAYSSSEAQFVHPVQIHRQPQISPVAVNPYIPEFASLSTQMTQAYSHVVIRQNSVVESIREKIQQALNSALPEIVELDKLYEGICKAFAIGQIPPKPEGMVKDLMPYQWRGYKWMEIFYKYGIGGCLADEMGLGKTIQSIALIQAIINEKRQQEKQARILIACPSNLIGNWINELIAVCPDLEKEIGIIQGSKKEEVDLPSICLISHQKLRLACKDGAEKQVPFNQEWNLIICDEFHSFLSSKKSEKTIIELRKKVEGQQHGFFALTGTPMPNNLRELYRLNAMLNPTIYPAIQQFEKAVMKPAKDALRNLLSSTRINGGKIPANFALKQLNNYIVQLIEILAKPFLLRRRNHFEEFKTQTAMMHTKNKAIQSLLPQEPEERVSYPFTEIQKQFIQLIVERAEAKLDTSMEVGALSLFQVNKKNDDEYSLDLRDMVCLQQVANHPTSLLASEKLMAYVNEKLSTASEIIKGMAVNYEEEGKLKSITKLVESILIKQPQDKILIFTNFEQMGKLLQQGLQASKLTSTIHKVAFLYGKLKKRERSNMIEEFEQLSGPPVLIASRKLGSVGWNCTWANHLIIADPWWNPNDDDQCIARLHRIGQTKRVHVYRMHKDGFVADEKMEKLRIEKKAWSELILSGNTDQVEERMRQIIEGNEYSPINISNSSVSSLKKSELISSIM